MRKLIIDSEFDGDPRRISIVEDESGDLQIQIEQQGDESFIDINLGEAVILRDELTIWIKKQQI